MFEQMTKEDLEHKRTELRKEIAKIERDQGHLFTCMLQKKKWICLHDLSLIEGELRKR